jgi:DNA-binding CsgD family transcriptional regulator
MPRTLSVPDIATGLHRLAAAAGDAPAWCAEAERLLQHAIPFDVAGWQAIDPVTVLMTGHWSRQLPNPDQPRFAGIARNEYLDSDVNRFADLARAGRTAASLAQATHGRPQASARYRDMLRPNGFGPELRAALVDHGVCWGSLMLLRDHDRADFTLSDVDILARLAPPLARILRGPLVAPVRPTDGPGVVLIDGTGVPDERTPAAARWLARLPGDPPDVLATAAAAVLAAGSASLCARATDGTWLALDAAPLEDDPRRVCVIIAPAPASSTAPRLMAALGLSRREQEITNLVLAGQSTEQIGRALFITPYTVKDHLKVIFDKAGVRSRRELSARLFALQRPDLGL